MTRPAPTTQRRPLKIPNAAAADRFSASVLSAAVSANEEPSPPATDAAQDWKKTTRLRMREMISVARRRVDPGSCRLPAEPNERSGRKLSLSVSAYGAPARLTYPAPSGSQSIRPPFTTSPLGSTSSTGRIGTVWRRSAVAYRRCKRRRPKCSSHGSTAHGERAKCSSRGVSRLLCAPTATDPAAARAIRTSARGRCRESA